MKYYKRIDGPTLFSDEIDRELPGWMLICNSLYSPHLEERYNQVIKHYQFKGKQVKARQNKNKKKTIQSIRAKMSSMNIVLGLKSKKQSINVPGSPIKGSKSPGSHNMVDVIGEVRESKESKEGSILNTPRCDKDKTPNISPFKTKTPKSNFACGNP